MFFNKRKKRFLKRLLLLFITISVFFIFAELTLRFIGYEGNEELQINLLQTGGMKSDNPILVWELKPGITIKAGSRLDYSVNSDGLRDYERDVSEDSYKIVVLGDSLTYGSGVNLEEIYAKILEKKLNELNEKKYEVFNLGVSGYGTAQEVESLRVKGLKYDPDLIILGYTLNDPMEFNCRLFLTIPINCRLKGVLSQSKFLFFIRRSIHNLFPQEDTRHDTQLGLDEEKWKRVTKPFEELSKISQEEDIPVMIVVFPLLKDFNNYRWSHVHSKINDMGETQGFYVLDMFDSYKEYKAEDLQITKKDVYHPNKQGHEIAADAIFKTLINKGFLN